MRNQKAVELGFLEKKNKVDELLYKSKKED